MVAEGAPGEKKYLPIIRGAWTNFQMNRREKKRISINRL